MKNILILGPESSGKTTKLRELLIDHPTHLFLDEAVMADQVSWFQQAAEAAKTHCIIVSQLKVKDFPLSVLAHFDIYKCEYIPEFVEPEPIGVHPAQRIITKINDEMPFRFYSEHHPYLLKAMRLFAAEACVRQRELCAEQAKIKQQLTRSGKPKKGRYEVDRNSILNSPNPEFLTL